MKWDSIAFIVGVCLGITHQCTAFLVQTGYSYTVISGCKGK